MKFPQPQLHPKENTQEPLPFSARDLRIKKVLDDAPDILSTPEWREFRREIKIFVHYLQDKYGAEAHKHTILHVLTASSFFPGDGVEMEDDFSGEDSVELFVNKLAEKYGLKN